MNTEEKKRIEEIRGVWADCSPEYYVNFILAKLDEAHAALRLIANETGHADLCPVNRLRDCYGGCEVVHIALNALGEEKR